MDESFLHVCCRILTSLIEHNLILLISWRYIRRNPSQLWRGSLLNRTISLLILDDLIVRLLINTERRYYDSGYIIWSNFSLYLGPYLSPVKCIFCTMCTYEWCKCKHNRLQNLHIYWVKAISSTNTNQKICFLFCLYYMRLLSLFVCHYACAVVSLVNTCFVLCFVSFVLCFFLYVCYVWPNACLLR